MHTQGLLISPFSNLERITRCCHLISIYNSCNLETWHCWPSDSWGQPRGVRRGGGTGHGRGRGRGRAWSQGRGHGKKRPVDKSADQLDKELETYHADAMNISWSSALFNISQKFWHLYKSGLGDYVLRIFFGIVSVCWMVSLFDLCFVVWSLL